MIPDRTAKTNGSFESLNSPTTAWQLGQSSRCSEIAETSDGRLYMAARFIKASGGCSAPASKDAVQAMANLGRIKLKLDQAVRMNQPALVQVMLSHPNHSGLAMNQLTRLYVPPEFVRHFTVSYGDELIMQADVDFTVSENPNFRLYFVPRMEAELKVEVEDTQDRKFSARLRVEPQD